MKILSLSKIFLLALLLSWPGAVYAQKKDAFSRAFQAFRTKYTPQTKEKILQLPINVKNTAVLSPVLFPSLKTAAQQSVRSAKPLLNEEALTQALQAKTSRGKRKEVFFKALWEKAEEILSQYPRPMEALQAFWDFEDANGSKQFFAFLAAAYHTKYISVSNPHLWRFLKQVEHQHNRSLEEKVLKRMSFIARHRLELRSYFAPNVPLSALHIRYMKNISMMTADSFRSSDLILSFEQALSAQAALRHINMRSTFRAGNADYPVYQYNGPANLLPQLYLYLINGQTPNALVTVVFDPKSRAMALYHEDKHFWLRITSHEYANPDNLHLHLNERRSSMLMLNKQATLERINYNLSIPLNLPVPSVLTGTKRTDYGYKIMVLEPLRILRNMPNVRVRQGHIS